MAVLAALWAGAAPGAAERPEDRWNLADLYPSVKACLDAQADFAKRYARLEVYASALFDEDTGSPESLELREKTRILGTRLEEAASFVKPEILRLGKARLERFYAREKSLAIYRHPLDRILRAAAHTLDSNGESIVAAFSLSEEAAGATRQILANADLPWPTLRLADGKEVKLEQSAYTEYREAANRDDRKKVFDAFWGTWKQFERTFGVIFHESLKKDAIYTRVRKYPDTLSRALDRERIPAAIYETLIAEINSNLPTLHRYFRLRAKLLGIAGEMRYYDIYPPLVSSARKYPIDEGKKMMLEAVKPLGERYVAAMAAGLQNRWMDVYPRPRKLSGAHMDGAAYDVHPFVLMSYNDNYESVSALVHEWGHAMHSYLSNAAQPFVTADYAIFVAEIASTFNEALLLEHVLRNAADDDERLLYLGSALEHLRSTFFRQAMFAEFERQVHARVDQGEPLSGSKLTQIYGEILRRYHGDQEGVVKIDDLYTVEWAYIPHFYRPFYVFQYATSIAASSLLADAVLKGEPGARERYLKLLSAGGSDYPYELVKAAGVDLASPAPYRAVVA